MQTFNNQPKPRVLVKLYPLLSIALVSYLYGMVLVIMGHFSLILLKSFFGSKI